MRDKKWLVRRVDNSNDGGLLLSCEGDTERAKKRVFHCGGRTAARYRNLLFNLNRSTAKLKGEKMQTIVINVNNDVLADKVRWLLEHFKNEGLEIVSNRLFRQIALLMNTGHGMSVWPISCADLESVRRRGAGETRLFRQQSSLSCLHLISVSVSI